MNKFFRMAVSALALCTTLSVVPGVASADEGHGRETGHVDRDWRGGNRDRGEGRFVGWERGIRDRWEYVRLQHARDCRIDYARGYSPLRLQLMGCPVR